LAQCYNVLPQLDINNTIDHRPEGDEKWFLENEKTVTQFCRKLAAERPLKDIRDEYNYPKKKGCVYGTLDFVGYPRFPAPVEFIAAVIAYYVHPVNIQTACLIMEGAEFTENIINGVERPVKAA